MKIGLADIPSPLLAVSRVVACGNRDEWHDLLDVFRETAVPELPPAGNLAATLHFMARLPFNTRRRIERVLDERGEEKGVSVVLRTPIGLDSKLLLTEGRLALSRSNDQQQPPGMVVGFSKFASAFADPGAVIRLPEPSARYDVEAALVAVIGRPTNRVSSSTAARSVIGFTLLAEITHRDMFDAEARTNNSLFAKNCLGLSPCGPFIRIASEREVDPATEITLAQNGTVRQRFTVSDFAHGIAVAVKAWSRTVLMSGDMVALGAAIARPRAGNAVDSPIPLAPGDTIEVTCPLIGVLKATVASAG